MSLYLCIEIENPQELWIVRIYFGSCFPRGNTYIQYRITVSCRSSQVSTLWLRIRSPFLVLPYTRGQGFGKFRQSSLGTMYEIQVARGTGTSLNHTDTFTTPFNPVPLLAACPAKMILAYHLGPCGFSNLLGMASPASQLSWQGWNPCLTCESSLSTRRWSLWVKWREPQ